MPKFKWAKWNILGLVVLLQSLIVLAGTPLAAQAQDSDFHQSGIQTAQVDPNNGSLWVVWYDQNSLSQRKNYISHYSAEGHTLGSFEIVVKEVSELGFVFAPGVARYYYLSYNSDSHTTMGVAYLDLLSGKFISLTSSLGIADCSPAYSGLVYNPELKHLYIPCAQSDSFSPVRELVADLPGDKVIGTLPYDIMGYNPTNGKIYATKKYVTSSDSYGSKAPFINLITLNAKTEQPVGDPLATAIRGPYGYLRSLLVNSKTGYVYAMAGSCFAKCSTPDRLVFDKDGKAVDNFKGALTEEDLFINEATNQLYGHRYQYVNREFIAVDASGKTSEQLAGFYWSPLAVDSGRNRLYAVDNRGSSLNSPPDRGLGILIMDGTNYDIIQFIKLRAPDASLTDKAKRLNAKPEGFQGWFFTETGHTLGGKFLDYWNKHGSLAIFGFPITEEFEEVNPDDGKTYRVQYFERNRFEYHPENAGTFYEVQLGLLGRAFSAQTGPAVSGYYNSGETEPVPGGFLFKETGHTLTGKFLEYWQTNGGLAQFGLPATEPFQELSPIDGKTYTVQYFERNRFELHPENAGTKYEVLLGLLGTQILRSRGWPI